MKVKNISARGWLIGGVMIAPGAVAELDDRLAVDIEGSTDLEIIKEKPSKTTDK